MERFSSYRVLVVDDDICSLESIIGYLRGGVDTVFGASDINKAKKIIKENKLDVIFSDIGMSDGDGCLLIEWLLDEGLDIPVILIGTYNNKEELFRAIKLGIINYVIKPLNFKKIQTMLNLCHKRLKDRENIVNLADGFYWDANNNILFKSHHSIKLTSNEIKFFELLLKNPGRAINTEEIFYYIYNDDRIEYNSKNIRNLVYKLRKKVGKKLIENIYGGKYRINIVK